MKIERNSWHYRVYSWFVGGEKESVNLCPYVRTVFLWVPLRFFFGDGRIGRMYLAAITYPTVLTSVPLFMWLRHHIQAAKGVLIGYLICATAAGIIFGGVWLGEEYPYWRRKRLIAKMTKEEASTFSNSGYIPERLRPRRFKAIREGWNLLCEYARAAHEKVCPLLTVEDK